MHFFSKELVAASTALRAKLYAATQPVSWRDRIRIYMPRAKVTAPATTAELDAAEKEIGNPFPMELRELLLETNGVDGLYSSPVCSVDRIISMNREFRSAEYLADRMPFDHLLFFGDTGNGDDFAYPIYRNGEVGPVVFMWQHETDCREEYANGLNDFLAHYAVQFYAIGAKEHDA